MSKAPNKPRHVAIVGGGVSGLATAHALVTQARMRGEQVRVTVLNAAERFGGVVRSTYKDGYIFDEGPDCFIVTKPEAIQLARELGIENQLISTQEGLRQSYILSRGRLEPIPKGFFLLAPTSMSALAKTPLLSWAGKLRAAMDFVIPRRTPMANAPDDESLTSFVTRRFGSEVHDRIAQPMVAGIYTADPEQLSLRATFPDFLDIEQQHGSVIRGMMSRASARSATSSGTEGANKASGARYGMFRSFRLGMGQLISELVKFLEAEVDLRRSCVVRSIARNEGGFRLVLKGGEEIEADQLCLAIPAKSAARLLNTSVDASLQEVGSTMRDAGYASSAIVSLAYDIRQVKHPMDGMGFVVPAVEHRNILACSFSHQKWPGRAPEGKALLRAFIGGALHGDLVGQSDSELTAMAHADLASILGIRGEPELVHVSRWRASMAQYHVGHVERVAKIRAAEAKVPNLVLTGNGYDGVGIPDCIRNAKRAAKRLAGR